MVFKTRLTIEDVERSLQVSCRTLLREIQAAEEVYQDLLNAQDGQTVLAWTRELYDKPDTGNVTLSINDVTGVISCKSGANFFAGFQVGRDAQITNFTNAGNNQTTEILAQTADSITIDNTGLVSETDDPNARVQQNPTTEEQDVVTAAVAASDALHDLYLALTTSVTALDRAALFRDFA